MPSIRRPLSKADRYQEWLRHVFDHPVTPNGWYFDTEYQELEAADAEIVELFTRTMENSANGLASYSDDQVGHGLNYLFSNACSNVVFSLMSESVEPALKLRALASIETLYRDCFTPRCAPALGHLSQPGGGVLNYICYMLWDVSPLSYWENHNNKQLYYTAIAGVLEAALTSENPACVESALHGLGHIECHCPDKVSKIIGAYLSRNVFVAPELRRYAQNAATGNVQ